MSIYILIHHRRRQLGAVLRTLRESTGLTATQVAARMLCSQSKISRLENGNHPISQRDVRELCRIYRVRDPEVIDALLQMANESGRRRNDPAALEGECALAE